MESNQPEPDAVEAAIDYMTRLDITVNSVIHTECWLHQYIVLYTPLRPLGVYAMAAHHGIHSLAVQASAYLLDLELSSVSDELTGRMGAQYLMKLIRLHAIRSKALRQALLVPPQAHPIVEVDSCGFAQQQKAKRIWAFFCAESKWHSNTRELFASQISYIWLIYRSSVQSTWQFMT